MESGSITLQGEVQNIHPVRLWSGLGLRSYGGHPRANARGVLSFDLEALDRWYGVKKTLGSHWWDPPEASWQ